MKVLRWIGLFVLAGLVFCQCGSKTDSLTTEQLYEAFRQPSMEYHPFVRWWWNGDKVEADELIREMRLLKEAGIGGVENIEIVFPGGGDPYYAHVGLDELDKVPEMPKAYPEFSQHKELPAWGFFIRHVDGLTMKNISLKALKKDYRTAIVLDDVSNHHINELQVDEPNNESKESIYERK